MPRRKSKCQKCGRTTATKLYQYKDLTVFRYPRELCEQCAKEELDMEEV